MHQNPAADELLKSWGFSVSPKMVEVQGRILPPPVISLNGSSMQCNTTGQWRIDGSKQFARGTELSSWSVAVFASERDCNPNAIDRFINVLGQMMNEKGIRFYAPRRLDESVVFQRHQGDVEGTLRDAAEAAKKTGEEARSHGFNAKGPELIICIVMIRNTVSSSSKVFGKGVWGKKK